MSSANQPDRADHLMRTMHPVFSHDLPNQLVAMQSLLGLLEAHEASRLDATGKEYLGRLQRVAQKAAGMVRFLREVGRLHSLVPRTCEMELAGLARDIAVELHAQIPGTQVVCESAGAGEVFLADARLLVNAIVEILRCMLERFSAPRSLCLSATSTEAGVELRGELTGLRAAPVQGGRTDTGHLQRRLEIVLAQELLATWGGRVNQLRESADSSYFVVITPSRWSAAT